LPVLIACIDCLEAFPKAINAVFGQTQIQLCIVHMVVNSMKYVSCKDHKTIVDNLNYISISYRRGGAT
jgi:putative transposase